MLLFQFHPEILLYPSSLPRFTLLINQFLKTINYLNFVINQKEKKN